MKQKEALGALLGNLGENGGGLGGIVSESRTGRQVRQQERPEMKNEGAEAPEKAPLSETQRMMAARKAVGTSVLKKPTQKQIQAVEKAQNSQRGRGRTKGERVMIAFKTPVDLVEQIENIHYSTGITKNDLYQEALEDLIRKYSK